MEYEFSMVQVIRDPETETYTIAGLPEGKDFRRAVSYTRIEASMLKVNGFAVGTSGMDIGEYEETVVIEQENGGGLANIVLEKNEGET